MDIGKKPAPNFTRKLLYRVCTKNCNRLFSRQRTERVEGELHAEKHACMCCAMHFAHFYGAVHTKLLKLCAFRAQTYAEISLLRQSRDTGGGHIPFVFADFVQILCVTFHTFLCFLGNSVLSLQTRRKRKPYLTVGTLTT